MDAELSLCLSSLIHLIVSILLVIFLLDVFPQYFLVPLLFLVVVVLPPLVFVVVLGCTVLVALVLRGAMLVEMGALG